MADIELKDYAQARETATQIYNIGKDIMSIFDSIDRDMAELYGETWLSSGADVSNGRYQELKSNYVEFYGKIESMYSTVTGITNTTQATDTQVGASLS